MENKNTTKNPYFNFQPKIEISVPAKGAFHLQSVCFKRVLSHAGGTPHGGRTFAGRPRTSLHRTSIEPRSCAMTENTLKTGLKVAESLGHTPRLPRLGNSPFTRALGDCLVDVSKQHFSYPSLRGTPSLLDGGGVNSIAIQLFTPLPP